MTGDGGEAFGSDTHAFAAIPYPAAIRHVDEVLQEHACIAEQHCRRITTGRREAQAAAFGDGHREHVFAVFYAWLNGFATYPVDVERILDAREALAAAVAETMARSTSFAAAVCPDAVCREASARCCMPARSLSYRSLGC